MDGPLYMTVLLNLLILKHCRVLIESLTSKYIEVTEPFSVCICKKDQRSWKCLAVAVDSAKRLKGGKSKM